MTRDELNYYIAKTAYKVGIGAQKHFATYDIVLMVPLIISLGTLTIGVLGFIATNFTSNAANAFLVILGIINLYISNSYYYVENEKYKNIAIELNKILIDIERIYLLANVNDESDNTEIIEKLNKLEDRFLEISLANQIIFAGTIAKYRFSRKSSKKWIMEELCR